MVKQYLASVWIFLLVFGTAQADKKLGQSTFSHIETIAADTFEGRLAGSEGGYAAANYITKILSENEVKPAGDGSYFQLFSKVYPNCRNIFGIIEGTDPELSKQLLEVINVEEAFSALLSNQWPTPKPVLAGSLYLIGDLLRRKIVKTK